MQYLQYLHFTPSIHTNQPQNIYNIYNTYSIYIIYFSHWMCFNWSLSPILFPAIYNSEQKKTSISTWLR